MSLVEVTLGERMHSAGFVLKGDILFDHRWGAFLHQVIDAIGMTAVAAATIFSYPIGGKGGLGKTWFIPITESFLVLDTWPDHDGAYLFVSSCRSYDVDAIVKVAHNWGLKNEGTSNRRFYSELDLT